MNEFVTLLNTFASMKIHDHSKIIPMMDIKLNVASEKYSLAACQVRENIQEYQSRKTLSYEDAGIQILEMLHNSILDMDRKHHNDYMVGLFELIKDNLVKADFQKDLQLFKVYSQDMNKEDSKKGLLEIAKRLNQKEFKHKSAVVLFIAQMLSTHDYLVSLKDKYL